MARIFINGVNAKTGGGRSVLNNYLSLLKEQNTEHIFFVLTPDKDEYAKYNSELLRIVDVSDNMKRTVLFPVLYRYAIPRLLREHRIDVILNFGDIVIPSGIPQINLFDWPYAVYPDSIVWKMMDFRSYLTRSIKLAVFRKYLKHADVVIAQTKTMKQKLESLYGLQNVEVIPNAVSLENMAGGEYRDFQLPDDTVKFLYLTYYYPHKNLEILLPLAKEIKKLSLSYRIVITIDSTQHPNAERLLDNIRRERLDDIIINVGPVPMKHVPSLYAQCDALLMPTLLESFSGAYVEAMYHQKAILTSDFDFAKDVCGPAAYYFDPLDVDSILCAMKHVFESNEQNKYMIEEGKKQLDGLLSWKQAYGRIQDVLEKTIKHQ